MALSTLENLSLLEIPDQACRALGRAIPAEEEKMTLITARFDLDETVPGPNGRGDGRQDWVLPLKFPFLINAETGEVVEPVLLFLRYKYNAPSSCYRAGSWTKQASADAAASDLKDWWGKLEATGTAWDAVDETLIAKWLIDLKTIISGRSNDFLAEATVKRRAETIGSLYKWAQAEGALTKAPEAASFSRLAETMLIMSHSGGHGLGRGQTNADPHPISEENIPPLFAAMGPLPSEIEALHRSQTRPATKSTKKRSWAQQPTYTD